MADKERRFCRSTIKPLFATGDGNVAVLNLGGLANLTWLGRDGSICAFDDNGAVASKGVVSSEILSKIS